MGKNRKFWGQILKTSYKQKLLGFVPEIIQLVYDLQFNFEKQAD